MSTRTDPDPLLAAQPKRIAVIKPSALGDVVQTLPLLPVLRERFPEASITWVVNRELADVVAGHPDLDGVIRVERRGGLSGWRRLLSELRAARFDLVFDLQGLLRTALMTWATRAPIRIGLETAREGSHLACHRLIPDTGRLVPAHLRYWRVAEALGLGDRTRATKIPLRDEHRAFARSALSGGDGPILAISPGARWVTKRWPVEKFAVIAAKAFRAYGFRPVIVGGPGEQPLAGQLEHLLQKFLPSASIVNLAGKTGLLQLSAVLEAADVLLTNDSGPMHLAAGLGTHVVGVFTCTSAVRSGPPGDQHALVSTKLSCAASYRRKCPYRGKKHMGCFEELSVDRTWSAFATLVERFRRDVRAA